MAYANTFKRVELKFLLDEKQYEALVEEISPHVCADEFGLHTIMNVYFDNKNDEIITRSLEKPDYKEKLRLRVYGTHAEDNSGAFLEIKKKYRGIVYKRRLEADYKSLWEYSNGGKFGVSDAQRQIFGEAEYLKNRLELKPKIVICYDRQAYFGKNDSEFRITFDSNIRYRREELDLRNGDCGRLLKNQPFRVMELKSARAVPFKLARFLSENKIYHRGFSKYGMIYTNEIIANGAEINGRNF